MMQLVLWGLFVLVCLAAAGLAQIKSGMWRISLQPPQRLGSIEVRLPSKWEVSSQPSQLGEQFELREQAPPGRTIEIRCLPLDGPATPMEFIAQSGLLDFMTLSEDDIRKVERLSVPHGEGVIVHPTRGRPSFALMTYQKTAVLIQMTSSGRRTTAEDEAILYHLANSIRVIDTPRPSAPVRDYEI